MTIRTAQRRVARPLIARNGGTHKVDLAIGADEATRGLEESPYSYEDEHGDKHTTYRPPVDRDKSPLASFGYDSNEVEVTECASYNDEAYLNDDIQPEPSEADGEDQNMGGAQEEVPRGARNGINPGYRRRSGGIG